MHIAVHKLLQENLGGSLHHNQEDWGALGAEMQLLQDVESQNSDDGQPEIREVDSVAVLNSRHLRTHQFSRPAHTAP